MTMEGSIVVDVALGGGRGYRGVVGDGVSADLA